MQELKKGSLGLLLLHLLHERPSYGYELCERLRARSGGTLSFEDGAIYPLLHSYERQGLIEGYWVSDASAAPTEGQDTTHTEAASPRRGPRRRYYRLTPQGAEALKAVLGEWRAFAAGVERILSEPGLAWS
ncbi:MAG: helix-turn-helix transcriptional regulator [Ktedonobacterales bacterium]|nr:helix-turn-helix transcriptional regulator [Ktedonobacterales bacterium]